MVAKRASSAHSGLHAVAGILAALAWRERSGQGQHIDLALLDVQVSCLANQALNYLVTGRSLNDVGSASGGSQDALASASQGLQGAGAGLVAKRIGQRLGLDEASVEENEMIGGSALTIGEYLSPRLYLSYGVGLFEPGEVIAMRYKLSKEMGVRIQRGSEETRAGVEYRIER